MNEGLIIGRLFIFVGIIISIIAVIKPNMFAKFTYNFRKKDWGLTENSIPLLRAMSRFCGCVMLPILVYLFITLPKHMH